MNWIPIDTIPSDKPVLVADHEHFAVGRWVDTTREEEVLVSQRGNRKTYETVKVKSGYIEIHPDSPWFYPTHWANVDLPEAA